MLTPKAISHRVPSSEGTERTLLDTEYNDKQLRVWISSKPGVQPDNTELGETDRVHLAILVNHHEITRKLGDILKKSQTGDAVVVACQTQKTYQAVLKFLGYVRETTSDAEA